MSGLWKILDDGCSVGSEDQKIDGKINIFSKLVIQMKNLVTFKKFLKHICKLFTFFSVDFV